MKNVFVIICYLPSLTVVGSIGMLILRNPYQCSLKRRHFDCEIDQDMENLGVSRRSVELCFNSCSKATNQKFQRVSTLRIRGGQSAIHTDAQDPDFNDTVTLVLMRHGESVWNAENRFTGWMDVPLTAAGERDAVAAGQLLHKHGVIIDCGFTSVLQRAIKTLQLVCLPSTNP